MRYKINKIISIIINTGPVPKPIYLFLLGFGIINRIIEIISFSLIIGFFIKPMFIKIFLKFRITQSTCRDDDEHIIFQLFKSKKKKICFVK